MTWRIAITHTTGYRYRKEVTSSYNEARITPISNDRQLVLESMVAVTPVRRRLPLLGLLGHARPRLRHPRPPPRAVGDGYVGGGDVGPPRPARRRRDLVRPGPARRARPLRRAAGAHHPRPPRRRRAGRGRAVPPGVVARRRLRGGGGVGERRPPLPEGHHRRVDARPRRPPPGQRGVPGLRPRHPGPAAGDRHPLPLRVRLPPPPRGRRAGTALAGESHAWIEAWTGDWQAFDPTNGAVAERHVVVGRARDYSDLSPLHGIYHGGPAEALGVSVELTRLS